jgi:hypothetical protein
LLADVCILQQQFPKPKAIHIKWYNNLVKRAFADRDSYRLSFVDVGGDIVFLGSSDAAWNNAEGFKSQCGCMIWACDRSIIEGKANRLIPIMWQSKKQSRIANSTLSAEAMACSHTVDELDYINAAYREMINGKFDLKSWHHSRGMDDDKYLQQRSGVITIDAKSLFDSVNGAGTKMPACKRTALEVALINETARTAHHSIRWVPTQEMLADVLTKLGCKAKRVIEVLAGQLYKISGEEENFVGWMINSNDTMKDEMQSHGICFVER